VHPSWPSARRSGPTRACGTSRPRSCDGISGCCDSSCAATARVARSPRRRLDPTQWPSWAPTCWLCSTRTTSTRSRTAASPWAEWSACGWPRTRRSGSRGWGCAAPRRTCRLRRCGPSGPPGPGRTAWRHWWIRSSPAGSPRLTSGAARSRPGPSRTCWRAPIRRGTLAAPKPSQPWTCAQCCPPSPRRPWSSRPRKTPPPRRGTGRRSRAPYPVDTALAICAPCHGGVAGSSVAAMTKVGAAHLANYEAPGEITAALEAHLTPLR
jgi:hypothetical protein